MTRLVLEGWVVKEGTDMENKLFFYSSRPEELCNEEFSASLAGDNVFEIKLPINEFVTTNISQRCMIKIELEK